MPGRLEGKVAIVTGGGAGMDDIAPDRHGYHVRALMSCSPRSA